MPNLGDSEDNKTTQPTITTVFRFLQDMDSRINARFDNIENRLASLESRMDGLESRMAGLESRMDGLESRMDGLESRMDGLESRMAGLESRMDSLEVRLTTEIAAVNERIEQRSNQSLETIKAGFEGIDDKIERADLHCEAEYKDLRRRIRQVESRIP